MTRRSDIFFLFPFLGFEFPTLGIVAARALEASEYLKMVVLVVLVVLVFSFSVLARLLHLHLQGLRGGDVLADGDDHYLGVFGEAVWCAAGGRGEDGALGI